MVFQILCLRSDLFSSFNFNISYIYVAIILCAQNLWKKIKQYNQDAGLILNMSYIASWNGSVQRSYWMHLQDIFYFTLSQNVCCSSGGFFVLTITYLLHKYFAITTIYYLHNYYFYFYEYLLVRYVIAYHFNWSLTYKVISL